MKRLSLMLLALVGLGCAARPVPPDLVAHQPAVAEVTETVPSVDPVEMNEPMTVTTPSTRLPPIPIDYDISYCHVNESFCRRMHHVLSEERPSSIQPLLITRNRSKSTLMNEWNSFLGRLAPDVAGTLREPLLLQIPDEALIDDGVFGPYIDMEWLLDQQTSTGFDGIGLVYWDFPAIMHERFMQEYDLVYRGQVPVVNAQEEDIVNSLQSEQAAIAWLAYLTRGYETVFSTR